VLKAYGRVEVLDLSTVCKLSGSASRSGRFTTENEPPVPTGCGAKAGRRAPDEPFLSLWVIQPIANHITYIAAKHTVLTSFRTSFRGILDL
jgi:hypothetical protein